MEGGSSSGIGGRSRRGLMLEDRRSLSRALSIDCSADGRAAIDAHRQP